MKCQNNEVAEIEAQDRDVVKQNTCETSVINVIKQRTRFTPVTLDSRKVINLPVCYSLNVSEVYHNSFAKTNDCRAVFCDMVYKMVEDNIKFVDGKEEIRDYKK